MAQKRPKRAGAVKEHFGGYQRMSDNCAPGGEAHRILERMDEMRKKPGPKPPGPITLRKFSWEEDQ